MRSAQSYKDSKLFRSVNKVTNAHLFLRTFEAIPGTLKCQIHMLANAQQHSMLRQADFHPEI